MEMSVLMTIVGVVMMLLMLVGLAWVLWLAGRGLSSARRGGSPARDVLDERYARGELWSEEYGERRRALERG